MRKIIKKEKNYEFIQDNGETTGWFEDIEEKSELSHKGSPLYKKIFYILISLGIIYLITVFTFFH